MSERDNKGRFGPGNPGKPKGAAHKVSSDLRKRITAFLTDNWDQVQEDFDALDPKDRLAFYERLMQYGLPKLQSVEYVNDLDKAIDAMSEAQLDYVIKVILDKANG